VHSTVPGGVFGVFFLVLPHVIVAPMASDFQAVLQKWELREAVGPSLEGESQLAVGLTYSCA